MRSQPRTNKATHPLPNYKTILVLVSLGPGNERSNIIFPTNTQMAEFLSTGKITGAQADPGEQTLQTSRPMKKSL